MRKRNRNLVIRAVVMALLVIFIAGIALAVRHVLPDLSAQIPFMDNMRVIGYYDYYGIDPAVPSVIMDDQHLTVETAPVVAGEEVFLPYEFVQERMDPFLFWDENAKLLYRTTYEDVMWFKPNVTEYHINGETRTLEDIPARLIEGEKLYVSETLVEFQYPFDVVYKSEYNVVIITSDDKKPHKGLTVKKTAIRYNPNKRSDLARTAEKEEQMFLYSQEEDFTHVLTEDGLLGYVLTKDLQHIDPPPSAQPGAVPEPPAPLWDKGTKINLMWDVMSNPDGNATRMQQPLPDGVNVISPTWFTFDAAAYELVSIGRRDYVNWAHEQNAEVWGLVSDITEGAEYGSVSHEILSDAGKRSRIIQALLQYAEEYGLDGINIDFEQVAEEDGGYYIQFLRELAPPAHKAGLALSVDVYAPSEWSAYYRRDAIGQTADFVAVMAYDEHYRGSPEGSGPVASLPFVSKAVTDMLELVPKEKLLMGLPFYNRIWREILGNDNPENRQVRNIDMGDTAAYLAENNVEMAWDAEIGSFYGEFAAVEDGVTVLYRIWQEDEASIAEKLKIFKNHDLAGIAGWRRGFENEAVQVLLKEACE